MPLKCRSVVTAKLLSTTINFFMKNFKKLSRAEMKNVAGGGEGTCAAVPCSFVMGSITYYGTCSRNCPCVTQSGYAGLNCTNQS
jgi:hypothetical protein